MTPRLLPLALALLLPACDGTAEFTIGGVYVGGTGGSTAAFDVPETASGGRFTFGVTVTQAGPGGASEVAAIGTGSYDHPAIRLAVEDEAWTGTVAADGGSFRLELEPGTFVTFTRE